MFAETIRCTTRNRSYHIDITNFSPLSGNLFQIHIPKFSSPGLLGEDIGMVQLKRFVKFGAVEFRSCLALPDPLELLHK